MLFFDRAHKLNTHSYNYYITTCESNTILKLYLMHGVYSHLICFVPQFYRLSLSLLM